MTRVSPAGAISGAPVSPARLGVAVITRNRRDGLLATLPRLLAVPERPPVVVVDNGSTDGTAAAVRRAHPGIGVVALGSNLGAAARTLAARALGTPYVAFADDDSWWAPGALQRAADVLDAAPRLALLAAKILVGRQQRLDAACAAMRSSPLPREPDLPGPSVLGAVACGTVVRTASFLAAGGFHPRFGVGGEETVLALDLAAAGWGLAYVEDVVAHHHPSPVRDLVARRRHEVRNRLWTAWLRRAPDTAWRQTAAAAAAAPRDAATRYGLAEALRGLPWAWPQRRRIPDWLEARMRLLEA